MNQLETLRAGMFPRMGLLCTPYEKLADKTQAFTHSLQWFRTLSRIELTSPGYPTLICPTILRHEISIPEWDQDNWLNWYVGYQFIASYVVIPKSIVGWNSDFYIKFTRTWAKEHNIRTIELSATLTQLLTLMADERKESK